MKYIQVYFTREEYNQLAKASKKLLLGRRGSHTRNRRIRKKLVQEGMVKVIDMILKDLK